MKKCFKCGIKKPLSEFYKHSGMNDGYLNKCKECIKKDNKNNYFKNHEYYLEYDRSRIDNPKRKEYRINHSRWLRKNKPEKVKEYLDKYNQKQRQAANLVNNAIRDGRLEKKSCEICGDAKSEAHHDDYSKPLEVKWLCKLHHGLRHREINQNKRRSA